MVSWISFGLGFLAAALVFGALSIADVIQFGKDAKDLGEKAADEYNERTGDGDDGGDDTGTTSSTMFRLGASPPTGSSAVMR